MEKYLNSPAHKTLWAKAHEGFKLISGKGWEQRASYEHFWPLCEQLYKLAYGEKAELPNSFKASLGFMFTGHLGRKRKGIRERPYFHHILMVLYLSWLAELPYAQQYAAIHHDDVEDVPKNLGVPQKWVIAQITSLMVQVDAFHEENGLIVSPNLQETVIATVANLTNDDTAPNKHAAQVAKMQTIEIAEVALKILDRIANMQDMRRDAPPSFNHRRVAKEIDMAWELATSVQILLPDAVLGLLAFATRQLQEEWALLEA